MNLVLLHSDPVAALQWVHYISTRTEHRLVGFLLEPAGLSAVLERVPVNAVVCGGAFANLHAEQLKLTARRIALVKLPAGPVDERAVQELEQKLREAGGS